MSRWQDPEVYLRLYEILLRPECKPNYVFAAKIGVAPSRLSEWARNKRPIPTDKLMLLCEMLRLSPEYVTEELTHEELFIH